MRNEVNRGWARGTVPLARFAAEPRGQSLWPGSLLSQGDSPLGSLPHAAHRKDVCNGEHNKDDCNKGFGDRISELWYSSS